MLELDGVSAGYGPVQALSAVSVRVMPGEIVTLIGANGAGKSTLLMTICGDPRPRAALARAVREAGRTILLAATPRDRDRLARAARAAEEVRRDMDRACAEARRSVGATFREARLAAGVTQREVHERTDGGTRYYRRRRVCKHHLERQRRLLHGEHGQGDVRVRERAERAAARTTPDPDDARTHERRADRAAYLREKLDEQAASQDEA